MYTVARPPTWLVWLVVGTLIALTFPWQPSLVGQAGVAMLIGVGACVSTVAGVLRNRPADARAWWLIVAGVVCWVSGDMLAFVCAIRGVTLSQPNIAQYLYLCAYPLLAAGLLRLSRNRLRRLAGLIDSAIIAIGLAIVYWTFVIGPIVTDPRLPGANRLALVGYPAGGIILCAVVAPLVLRRGPRTTSTWLLTVGSVFTLFCNITYTLVPEVVTTGGQFVYAVFLISYVCWAAAALHPTAGTPTREPAATEHLGPARIALLAVSMLLVPAVLLVRRTHSVDHLGWLVIGLGSAVLILLVLTRLAGFVNTVQHQSDRLRDLAMRDALTGLASRRNFEEAVTAALTAGAPQIAVIDLADFKNINDRLGRAAADGALVAVARRLRESIDDTMLVARINGDEFALLVPDAAPETMDAVTRRIAGGLRRPVVTDGHDLLLNVRIGVTDSEGVANAGELLRRADTALDAAKRHGSRYRRYDIELDHHADENARLGADLRHALDGDEFRLVYQPIVALPGGGPVAAEALVRWQHPVRGSVSPADFIPVAERTGLIIELGAWIMRTACAQAVTWRAELGPDAPHYVSVNVSAHQLAQPDFAPFVASVLESTGLAGTNLLVEVTETAIFSGGPAVRTLERLRELGVRIALDDFGTGHSSLGLLQNVPVDVLKVDKSFVDNITMSGRHAVIAEALIKVAQGLGLDAVAEGVETDEQAVELHRLGYRLAQGYHFGRPVPQPEFRRAVQRAA